MDAGKRTINDIFNGNRILEIPFFQRSYVWEDMQWKRLLEDLESVCLSNRPYFLGSIILKQQLTNTDAQFDHRTLIDGQQRLTTLSILFKVLWLKTDVKSNEIYKINTTINSEYRTVIALKHNHNDYMSFENILNLEEEIDVISDDNITKAYRYFKENVDPSKLNIHKILQNILFVGIDLNENEDEQQIFDTINSIGVDLTTAELLKNFFFNRNELDLYKTLWEDVFEKDKKLKKYWDRKITAGRFKRTFIDLFFYSYLQIKVHDGTFSVTTEDKIEFSKVESLFESYKKFISVYLNNDKHKILSEIKDYASIFRNKFNFDVIENELNENYSIERINAIIFALETSTLIPYVLYILKNVTDPVTQNELFKCIECYVMRRMIAHESNKNYNQFFTDRLISHKILTKNDFLSFLFNQNNNDTTNSMPNDSELEQAFHSKILTNKQSAGILYLLESKIRNKKNQSTQLLGINKYSLEHLMPKKWRNNWTMASSDEANINRDKKLQTLGNLTIITQSLNSTIRDSDWTTKVKGNANKKGLIQYSSGIEIISEYLTYPEWNEKTIEERANYLYECAIEVWSI